MSSAEPSRYESSQPSFPIAEKYDGNSLGWDDYQYRVLGRAASLGIDHVILEEVPDPNTSPEASAAYKSASKRLWSELISTTKDLAFAIIKSAPMFDGAAAWDALESKFVPHTTARSVELVEALITVKLLDEEDPDVLFRRLDTIVRNLRSLKIEVPEEVIRGIAMKALPRLYDELKPILRGPGTSSYASMQDQVRAHFVANTSALRQPPTAGGTAALSAYTSPHRSVKKCSHCKRTGHLVSQCWDLHGRPVRKPSGPTMATTTYANVLEPVVSL